MASDKQYAVLLDAGSSGTRVYVYQWWLPSNIKGIHEVSIGYVTGWTEKKTGPGIQHLAPTLKNLRDNGQPVHISDQLIPQDSTAKTIAETSKKVSAYLDPLLDHARKFIPQDRIDQIPLFILATGGMRRHKLEHYEEYMILRDAITEYINNSGFRDPFYDTISGEDEALYGWVAANYVDGCFKPDKTPHGFMEMGGESAQFAVSINERDFGSYHGLLQIVTVWGVTYRLFVKTWMGLGVDSAWKRHQARLRESESAIPLDPCLPKGFAYRLSGSDKIVQGTGEFLGCMKEALSLLSCSDKECLMGYLCIYRSKPDATGIDPQSVGCLLRDSSTGNPIINFNKNDFCGASVYWHATHGIFAEVSMEDKEEVKGEDFSAFWKTVVEFSRFDWETLKAKRPRERKTGYQFLQRGFFTAAMIMTTLFIGFGIPMPSEALEATREFAAERAEQAWFAAEDTLAGATKKLDVAGVALGRAVEAAELTEKAEKDARDRKQQEDKENSASLEEVREHNINECKKLYKAWPNKANREDFLDLVEVTASAGDNLAKCTEAARKAREKRKAAEKETGSLYDLKAVAESGERRALKLKDILKKDGEIDKKLRGADTKLDGYTSIENADWTLGRIVLHINHHKPDIRSRHGWEEETVSLC